MRTAFTRLIGVDHPIIQAPMGGGPGTDALTIAVCEAGALGSVAGGYLTPEQLDQAITMVRSATTRPFAVNVFTDPLPNAPPADLTDVIAVIDRLRGRLDLPPLDPHTIAAPPTRLAEKIDVLAAARPAAVSFTFGPPPPADVERLHAAGCRVIGTATTVAEAVTLEQLGVDLVCAQGAEAGAHTGAFDGTRRPEIGLVALVPQVADAIAVPVLAAGGIMDGRGVAAALALGAAGAQCGTAFLLASEAGTSPAHRAAIVAAADIDTTITRAVTGRHARGIRNELIDQLDSLDVPHYPVMHQLTAELRRTAAARDRPELMALWAGQAATLARPDAAATIVHRLVHDADSHLTTLARNAEPLGPGAGERR